MKDIRFNYVVDLVYETLSNELRDDEEVLLFLKTFLLDLILNFEEWKTFQDLIEYLYKECKDVFDEKDNIIKVINGSGDE